MPPKELVGGKGGPSGSQKAKVAEGSQQAKGTTGSQKAKVAEGSQQAKGTTGSQTKGRARKARKGITLGKS